MKKYSLVLLLLFLSVSCKSFVERDRRVEEALDKGDCYAKKLEKFKEVFQRYPVTLSELTSQCGDGFAELNYRIDTINDRYQLEYVAEIELYIEDYFIYSLPSDNKFTFIRYSKNIPRQIIYKLTHDQYDEVIGHKLRHRDEWYVF